MIDCGFTKSLVNLAFSKISHFRSFRNSCNDARESRALKRNLHVIFDTLGKKLEGFRFQFCQSQGSFPAFWIYSRHMSSPREANSALVHSTFGVLQNSHAWSYYTRHQQHIKIHMSASFNRKNLSKAFAMHQQSIYWDLAQQNVQILSNYVFDLAAH